MSDETAKLIERATTAISLGDRTGSRGASPTNIYNVADDLLEALVTVLSQLDATRAERDGLAEALEPFATTAEQMDRELPHARDGKVTIVHPLDGVLPDLYGKSDYECPTWPLPDDLTIIDAWRYHDPLPASERICIQMKHLRAAAKALAALKHQGAET